MPELVYDEEQLMESHAYANPQIEAGIRLHGGFDSGGEYIPPRLQHRGPAIEAWTEALRARGGELLEADSSLLAGVRYPSLAQNKLLLSEGLGQSFWNTLTITGMIEARGQILAEMTFPEFQDAVTTDISDWALGHLNKGLLKAHGIDEGGEPASGIGGHDAMWFALRDLAFGEVDYPDVVVPDNIGRPETPQRFPQISMPIERTIYFLLNLLLIEFRAERGFSMTESLLRDPDLFRDRRSAAEHAAEIVGRIRTDELVHVSSLRLYLGEIRELDFLTGEGEPRLPGHEVVDTLWSEIVHWATVEQPKLAAEQQRQIIRERISAHPDRERIERELAALEEH